MLSASEDPALVEHLQDDPGAVERHIAGGGTLLGYIAEWQRARDAAAQTTEITPEIARRVLDLPVGDRWGNSDSTVRDYLIALLAEFWSGEVSHGMAGNSDWQYDLYYPLNRAGLIPGWRDGWGVGYRTDGTENPEDQRRADKLITAAINALAAP